MAANHDFRGEFVQRPLPGRRAELFTPRPVFQHPAQGRRTTRPVSSCRFTCGTPDFRSQQTTGRPQAIASTCTRPKASFGVTEGSANTSAACSSAGSVSSSTSPQNFTRSATPAAAAMAFNSASSGPVPTIHATPGTSRIASIRWRCPL